MSRSCKTLKVCFLISLLLTPLTPLGQNLHRRGPLLRHQTRSTTHAITFLSSGCASHHATTFVSDSIPWWWCRLKRKRYSKDSESEYLEEQILSWMLRGGACVADACLVLVHCALCTAWFFCICMQAAMVAVIGTHELTVW